jgi:cytochrome c oxidase subunit 1
MAPAILDRWAVWVGVAIVLVLIAYAVPLYQQAQMPVFGSPGYSPF